MLKLSQKRSLTGLKCIEFQYFVERKGDGRRKRILSFRASLLRSRVGEYEKGEPNGMHQKHILCFCLLFALALLCSTGTAEVLFDGTYMHSAGLYDEGVKSIYTVTYVGDTCYAYLDDESLRFCQPDGTLAFFCQLPKASTTEIEDIVTNIATDGSVLYGWNLYSGKIGSVDEAGIHWQDVPLQIHNLHPYGDMEAYRIAGSFVRSHVLYVFVSMTEYQAETAYAFYAYDLMTGQSTTYTIPHAVGVCPGEQDQFFFLCRDNGQWSVQMLNTSTNAVASTALDLSAFSAEDVLCGLAYDADAKNLYFACNNAVYTAGADGVPFQAAVIPTNGCMSESGAWVLSGNRYALCSMVGLNIVSLDAAEKEPSQLTIQGMSSTKVNEMFQSAYPDTLLIRSYEAISADALSTKLLTQDDTVDIYMVQVDATYTGIKAKGYFASLAGSALLQQACQDLSEPILEAITENEVLVAYPASLRFSTFGVNLDYWQLVFGDDPLPETMEDLLDAWILYEESYADEYPLLDIWYGFDEEALCRAFITHYIASHKDAASTLASDASLRAVLEKLNQVAQIRRAHQRTLTEWDADESEGKATVFSLFTTRDAMYQNPSFYVNTQENLVYDISIFQYTPLSLVWEKDGEEQVIGSMTVYVVNPYAKHQQEAVRYIECAAQLEANPYLYYALHTTMTEPYEDPTFPARVQTLTENVERIEAQLQDEDLDADTRFDLEAELSYDQRILQEQDKRKWLISADTIATDRALLNHMRLNLTNAYLPPMTSSSEIEQLCSRYVSGNLTLDMFLKTLANALEMITLETN